MGFDLQWLWDQGLFKRKQPINGDYIIAKIPYKCQHVPFIGILTNHVRTELWGDANAVYASYVFIMDADCVMSSHQDSPLDMVKLLIY